ncbi:hypothetical protein CISIN_1g044149mg [Citrus sinensis]|uniref:Uncharacterized protein n=1 Tax=Citrus sinensis TaxID=2711 RepID=A0A067ELA1_CITSI|nr:hypothetical protein CISIN_1g044149mg [Citrus sinensis]
MNQLVSVHTALKLNNGLPNPLFVSTSQIRQYNKIQLQSPHFAVHAFASGFCIPRKARMSSKTCSAY